MAKPEPDICPEVSEEDLQKLYAWVDEIPLSRPKRNINRDFADGVLVAEIVVHYFPRLVELHNYSPANSHTQKLNNWSTLQKKGQNTTPEVFKRLNFQLAQQDIDDVCKAAPRAIERVLLFLNDKITRQREGGGERRPPPPDAGRRSSRNADPRGADDRGFSPESHAPASVRGGAAGGAAAARFQQEVDTELLVEKEQTIQELREMIVIMSEKIKKLEQLVRIKDSKIEAMNQKLAKYGLV